jgi:hypothetical protein
MVDRLEKEGGQETKVSEYLKRLSDLDKAEDADTPPPAGRSSSASGADAASTSSGASSSSEPSMVVIN